MSKIEVNSRAYGSSQYARLSPEQCEKLHSGTLELLERTGVRLHDGQAVELLAKAGALVSDGNLVRLPHGMVEKAFTTVPKRAVLCNRYGERVLQIEGHRCFYGPGSDALHIVDHRSGERRDPVIRDVAEGATLCDALPNVDFVMSMFLPVDVEKQAYELYQMEAMLNNSTKPIIIVTHDLLALEACVEMAEAVAGGAQALQQSPYVTCYINVTSGLLHNKEALEKLIYLAGKGLPSIYIPANYGGLTAPMTVAGTAVAVNAGVLVGLVLSQVVREGATFIAPGWGGRTINMRVGSAAYFTPDDKGIMAAMAHHYHLPMFGYGGFSDSKMVDGQATLEAAMSLTFATLDGANLIHDMGYLEAGLSGSLAQLVICNEVIDWLSHATSGLEVSDQTLALDIIDRKGPEGNYLEDRHTIKHMRERWLPGLLDQTLHPAWEAAGSQSLERRASQRVDEILAAHTPPPLPGDVQDRIHTIVERECRRAGC